MKSKIQKKKVKKNGGILELLIPTFFQKRLLMRGQTFLGKKKYREVVLNWKTKRFINEVLLKYSSH